MTLLKTLRVPAATITRMSIYSRFLEKMNKNGMTTISSIEIADGVGVSPAQVRKDLAYFGEFGTRGVGYNIQTLLNYTLKILGLDQAWPLAIVGAGNLGKALSTYQGFNTRGFNVACIFDHSTRRVGQRIGQLIVQPMEKFPELVQKENIRIGVIAVRNNLAQEVADIMVRSGIQAILNFAPISIRVPANIEIRNVDLSITLELLTFNLALRAAQNL